MQPLDDLFSYNDWANEKVLDLCEGLSDEELDHPMPIGFGSLRATIFHIYAAEEIWLERWAGIPWRPFPTSPEGADISSLRNQLRDVSESRRKLLDSERNDGYVRQVEYQDSRKVNYCHHLFDLLLHVFNHGVHHRAQALNYLRQFERSAGPGIDYIFYRLSRSPLEQDAETASKLNELGFEFQTGPLAAVEPDMKLLRRWYQYNDWANTQVLKLASQLDNAQYEQPFEMGFGSVQKILMHMFDVERWMLGAWQGHRMFGQLSEPMSVDQLTTEWHELAEQRKGFLALLDEDASTSSLQLGLRIGELHFQLIETAIQTASHSTHHRAQLINLLRRLDMSIYNIDLLYALEHLDH